MRTRALLFILLFALLPSYAYNQGKVLSVKSQLQGAWENRTLYHFFRYQDRNLGDTYVAHRLTFNDSTLTRTLTCTNSVRHDTLRVDVIECNFRLHGDTLIMENVPLGQPLFYHPYNPYNYYNSEGKYFPYFPSATISIYDNQLELTYDYGTTLLDARLQIEYYANQAPSLSDRNRDSLLHVITTLRTDPRFVAIKKRYPVQTSILYQRVE